jgi:three-Cys-motif partner protein
MDATASQFDEIGPWSEVKLEIVRKYASAYSKAFTNQPRLSRYYIDGFAGMGAHISKATGAAIPGSPLIALDVEPPFQHHFLVDIDGDCVQSLRDIVGERSDVTVYHGDCNKILLEDVLPQIRYDLYRRALCLLDPRGLDLDWDVLAKAGELRTIDLWLNFPIMHVNRNVLRRTPGRALPSEERRMTRFWGDESWREIAYHPRAQGSLFGEEQEKVSNEELAEWFRARLRNVAKFPFVPEPVAMRNSTNAVVYYLFFASHNETANKISSDILRRYRSAN